MQKGLFTVYKKHAVKYRTPCLVIEKDLIAVVAQLVRVPACHAGGRGFEPRQPRQYFHVNNCFVNILCANKTVV